MDIVLNVIHELVQFLSYIFCSTTVFM